MEFASNGCETKAFGDTLLVVHPTVVGSSILGSETSSKNAGTNLIRDGTSCARKVTGVDTISSNVSIEGEFIVDSSTCISSSYGIIAEGETTFISTDETLTTVATVVPVEGIIATRDV